MTTSLEIALLARLLETGTIKKGVRTARLIDRFSTARWIVPGTRRAEWTIRETAQSVIEQRLRALLPTWKTDVEFLRRQGQNPYDPSTIEALPRLQRVMAPTPTILNHRNWNAAVGLGPKHRPKRAAPTQLTKDWILRFRPNTGLCVRLQDTQIDCDDLQISPECLIPERTWHQVVTLTGTLPQLLITCENLGAYIDFPANEWLLLLYSPGDDTAAAVHLLKQLPHVPWIHFGDLDPEGLAIGQRLAHRSKRPLRLLIPSFAADYLPYCTTPLTPWPQQVPYPFLQQLRDQKKALYQEIFMLDDRLNSDIEQLVKHALPKE